VRWGPQMNDGGIAAGLLISILTVIVAAPIIAVLLREGGYVRRIFPILIMWRAGVFGFYAFWVLPFYGGSDFDAVRYHLEGSEIALLLRKGMWANIDWGLGTHAVGIVTGAVYSIAGPNMIAMYFQGAVLGVISALVLGRTAEIALPPVVARRFTVLMCFLPSFSVWSSIFGKDSWVILGLSTMLYGCAILEKSRRGAVKLICIGAASALLFRPYLVFVFVPSLLIVACVMKPRAKSSRQFLLVGAAALACALFPAALRYVEIDNLRTPDILNRANRSYIANAVGGSSLDQEAPNSPTQLILLAPRGCVNMFLRPFPWEAHNSNAYLASIENIALALCVIHVVFQKRLALKGFATRPLWLFAVTCAIPLILLYSPNPNLGLLSRQRAQIIPLVAIAVCCGMRASARFRNTWRSGDSLVTCRRLYLTPASVFRSRALFAGRDRIGKRVLRRFGAVPPERHPNDRSV